MSDSIQRDVLFEDNFYQWLEQNGTDLDAQHTSGRWKGMIDLDKLKAAIQRKQTEARIESIRWALNDYNMPDTNTRKNLEQFITDLRDKIKNQLDKE